MRPDGTPTFAMNTVGVTAAELAEGFQYELAEVHLLKDGFEEPFVHFAEGEAPSFLHPAVRQFLRSSPLVRNALLQPLSEDTR
jgi:hypothetical protein